MSKGNDTWEQFSSQQDTINGLAAFSLTPELIMKYVNNANSLSARVVKMFEGDNLKAPKNDRQFGK